MNTYQEKVLHQEEERAFLGFVLLLQEFFSLHLPCTTSEMWCLIVAATQVVLGAELHDHQLYGLVTSLLKRRRFFFCSGACFMLHNNPMGSTPL